MLLTNVKPKQKNRRIGSSGHSEYSSPLGERGQALLSKQIEYYAISLDPGYMSL